MSSSHCTDGQWDWKTNPTFSPCLKGTAHARSFPRQKWFLLSEYPETWTQIYHEKNKFWQVKIGGGEITLLPSFMTEMCPFAHNPSLFFSFFFPQETLNGLSIHSYHLMLTSLVKLCITCSYPFTYIYTYRLYSRVCMWVWVTSQIVKRKGLMVGEVKHAWNPSIWEAEAEDSGIPDQSWLHNKTLLKRKVKVVN